MKTKHLFLALMAAGFVSCANDGDIEPIIESQPIRNIPTRSVDDAVRITNQLLAQNSTESRSHITVNKDDVKVIRSNKSRSEGIDTLMYAVNHGENQGFTLISAPMNVEPVIAFAEQGDFGSDKANENKAFQYVLGESEQYIIDKASSYEEAVASRIDPEPFMPWTKKDSVTTVIQRSFPRIMAKWADAYPLDLYAPNGWAGCTPVALAQMFYYYGLPQSLDLTYLGQQSYTQTLNWDSIRAHIGVCNSASDCSWPETTDVMIGHLVREIGHRCGAVYGVYGTTVNVNNLFMFLATIFPGKHLTYNMPSVTSIYDLLTEGGVAYFQGNTSSGETHAWVADASMELQHEVSTYVLEDGQYVLTGHNTINNKFVHFNWGWGGDCNGYFLDGVLDSAYKKYDGRFIPSVEFGRNSRTDYSTGALYIHISD